MNCLRLTSVLVALLVGAGATAQQEIGAQAMAEIKALQSEKSSLTPSQRKLSSRLMRGVNRALGRALARGVPELRSTLPVRPDGTIEVDIKAVVTPALLTEIELLGGTIVSSFPQYNTVRAELPANNLETLAENADVRFIREVIPPITNKINKSEGDVAHRANAARSNFGFNGSGVTVGVLSDSAEAIANLQASGDLPPGNRVAILPGQDGPAGSSEGSAMLEIVYDLAPGVDLIFATAFTGEAQFAQNIIDLGAAGCSVIVDDVVYFGEPVFEDGIIAQAVDAVAADGISYFSSAGNSGNFNDGTSGVWQGDYDPFTYAGGDLDGFDVCDFGSAQPTNALTEDPPAVVTLQWSDRFGSSANDFDLFLLSPDGLTVIDASTDTQSGTQDPFEIINSGPFDDLGLLMVISRSSGSADVFLHMNTNRGQLTIATDGQTFGHACAEGAFGVAAVDWAEADGAPFDGTEPVEEFSSDGPRRVFYDANGAPVTPGNFTSTGGSLREKPDIAAADGVSTATPGFNPFFGTSAAAPHAAAIAALLYAQGIAASPIEIRATFSNTSLDIETNGADRDSGSGLLNALSAMQSPVNFVYADFEYVGPQSGTFDRPFSTIGAAVNAVQSGGTIVIKASATGTTTTINKPLTLRSIGGISRIGAN